MACGNPLQGSSPERYRSGTSTTVGPAFFVGQSAELPPKHEHQGTANTLQRLGWVGLGIAALFVVAALEWQTWRPATTTSQEETVAVAQQSSPIQSRAESRRSARVITSTPAPRARVATASDSEATTQPVPPEPLPVTPTLPVESSAQAVESENAQTPEPVEVSGDSAKVRLLRAAIGRGDTDAPVSLANLYLEGKDVSRSCDEALTLLESAAAKNNARARNRLAAMYEVGTCVQRDRVQAYRWLNAALEADRNNSWAQQNRDQTWREMTSEERTMAEAYR